MSLNTANTPDGRGILIYNGEMILVFIREVNMSFENPVNADLHGKKQGNLYLTSHRIIFLNLGPGGFRSISMPFHSLRNVKLEQPIFGANYLTGIVVAQPDGNWNGEMTWRLTFNKGGCIDFGHALLKANDMANSFRPQGAPPQYAPPPGSFFSPPPMYYTAQGGFYNGFQAPVNAFPDRPPAENVYMYEQPPPYPGIGPDHAPHPTSSASSNGSSTTSHAASAPPSYEQAPPLPQKPKSD